MYNTWAYRCTKYERNRILSCDRDIDGPYRHSLLIAENGLSSLINLPPTARPIIDKCSSNIREIAVTAGFRLGESSSSSLADQSIVTQDSASQGMIIITFNYGKTIEISSPFF